MTREAMAQQLAEKWGLAPQVAQETARKAELAKRFQPAPAEPTRMKKTGSIYTLSIKDAKL
jgi:hypothetical protein